MKIGAFLILLLAAAGFSGTATGCAPSWKTDLARVEETDWTDGERRAFLTDSPFVKNGDAPVKNWINGADVRLHVTASWASSYFREKRLQISKRLEADTKTLLAYESGLSTDQATYAGPVLCGGEPPFPLKRKLLIASPVLKPPLAYWPTGPEAAREIYRELNIVPSRDLDLETELNEATAASSDLVVELALFPLIESWTPLQNLLPPKDCLNRLLGQIVLRGVHLENAAGKANYPKKAVILGGDFDGNWEEASWRFHEIPILAAPVFVRLIFPRQDKNGSWIVDSDREIRLRIHAPEGSAEVCAAPGSGGLAFSLDLAYLLRPLRQAGPGGL